METRKYGTPVNTKSLLAFIFNQMEKLNSGEIDWQTANAQAKLASQANNLLDYELKRTIVEIKLKEIGEKRTPSLREIESKRFSEEVVYDIDASDPNDGTIEWVDRHNDRLNDYINSKG